MTQQDCVKLLKKNKKGMTIKEMKDIMGITSVSANLLKLFKHKDVTREEIIINKQIVYLYKLKV